VDVFPVGNALVDSEWQPFVKTIIRVTRQTWLRSAATGMWQPRGEVSYYISSQQDLPAKTWAAIIRGHWGIEDRLHWVRDMDFDEDRSQIRTAAGPRVMASLRNPCPGVPAEGCPPPRDVLVALVASLRGELADALAALEETRADLARERVAGLEAPAGPVAAEFFQAARQHGLAKPPPRKRSPRKKTGRMPGRQEGHKGAALIRRI
jgi:hypothetical protein